MPNRRPTGLRTGHPPKNLKPGNILLDSLGHITLCDFGLCKLEINDEDHTTTLCGTLEYPAPELLLGQGYTKTVDWWTLGVFLYEMLIGLPPFQDEDTNEIHRKILSEPLHFPGPDVVPLSAKDILTKLLNRKPEQRLGANGASEIKAHPFFHSIDWHKLLQRKYEPTFKPNDGAMLFRQHDGPTLSQIMQQQFSGWSYYRPVHNIESKSETNTSEKDSTLAKDHKGSSALPGKDATAEGPTLPDEANPPLPSEPPQAAVEEDDGWVLIWEEAAQAFYFYKRFTNATQSANPRVPDPVAPGVEAPAAQKPPATRPAGGYDPAIHGGYDPTVHNLPSQSQMQDALEAALKAGYKHVVPPLSEYGMDLNIKIFRHGQTPLEWATEHENLDLVKLFLDKGANANFTIGIGGPALMKAVEKENQGLVEVLVQKTDRVPSTRALGLAVNQQDCTIVNILLVNGVSCDFEESNRPRPADPDSGCYFCDISEPEEFIPSPLVRAVNLGNINLVRLLLANGADVNVGYHLSRHQRYGGSTKISMSCGGVIQ
jgi:serum/glucocorticoid-regulated kinase 2